VLAAFLVLAFAFAIMVSRSLQARIAQLLGAARRLGRGDFDVDVPTEGSDEFAQLGTEFNQMARQLQSRLHELQREQARLQLAVRRVGDSFARGLDREALLDIAVETAVDGVGARCGRATVRDGARDLRQVAVKGDIDGFGRGMRAAEIAALDASQGVETQVGDTSVLSEPLLAEDGDEILGLITVARSGEAFTPTERDLFRYLVAQAAISVENADLHQAVRRQAVTDELTNLFNHRHFQEVLAAEVERARRYGQDLGLIMLDIDDFKRVNDTHGHLQGDLVLREVGRVLRESARDVDEPARYGGEEMAVVLPQTDLEGAYRFGERLRQRIEHLQMPRLDGKGTVGVTASIGAASLRGDELSSKDALVAAADAALYRAKRLGKNRTARAEVERDGRAY
jgi:diguanylate cyclase (GGDEF)-like protein